MSAGGSVDAVETAVLTAASKYQRTVRTDDVWISVGQATGRLPEQGWKLHISARPGTLGQTLERALPILFNCDCAFKVARSADVLGELNSGDRDQAVVGKALTVYPSPGAITELGHRLADALAGMPGPRVASDRRVRPDAPVYYRYGPFQSRFRVDDNGDYQLVITGPDGEVLPGAASLEFSCPPWAADPFRSGPDQVRTGPADAFLGGRYRLTGGVVRSSRGNVYRATDAAGRAVVIKEARAYVGEHEHGTDLRLHLRNERRILGVLTGLPGVPEFIDHFRHGEDEYLVTSNGGPANLHRVVNEDGLFRDGPFRDGRDRDLAALAGRLATIVAAVHARGVVIRDLSPKNVVLAEDGGCTLIDFGCAAYDGFQVRGWTRGYCVPDQPTSRPAEPADDFFSLGATLYFAATGMPPVMMGSDPAAAIDRTLLCLDRVYPEAAAGVVALLPGLMSLDPAERSAAFADLLAGSGAGADPAADPGPRRRPGPVLTDGLLAEIIEHTTRQSIEFAHQLMTGRGTSLPVTKVYNGSAGLGTELLHHAAAEETGLELAAWTAKSLPSIPLPASLYFGRTGISIYLATANRMDGPFGDGGWPTLAPVTLEGSEHGDYVSGLAGIGTGQLILSRLGAPDALSLAAECAQNLMTGQVTMPRDAVAPARPGTGVALETGFGHGRAGVASFLLAYHQATGDAEAGTAARDRFAALGAETGPLLDELAGPDARPMGASWCQGMAGIASAFAQAAAAYGDPGYAELARAGARACRRLAPQAWVVSQCCGLAGFGEAMIDVALVTGDEEFWSYAADIAELIVIRSGGDFAQPEFPDNSLEASSGDWATGTSGVLSFLRRLHRREGARLWSAGWTPPR
jgi:hypothetical protein